MTVTQYIGARYVPVFADPTEWSSDRAYEPLTIVLHEGNSYTSRQAVPVGIDITNDAFWAETGNYNAQVEAYRKEVLTYKGDITTAQETADAAKESATNANNYCRDLEVKVTANANSIKAEGNRAQAAEKVNSDAISAEKTRAQAAEKVNSDAISAEKTRAQTAETALGTRIDNIKTVSKRGIVIFGDSWTTYHNKVFMTTLAAQPNVAFCKCYGVGGAKVGDLPSQVTTAKADKTLDVYSVTDVFVIIGTNNVYWDSAVTQADSYAAFLTITQYFPYAKLHWFPNNSQTNNNYRNNRYALIGKGAAQAGFAAHYETLCVPFTFNTSWYPNISIPGYMDNQHLTEDCSKFFIMQCLSIADGGTSSGIFHLHLSYDTTDDSCWSGSAMTNAYYHGNYYNGAIELQFKSNELSVNSSITHNYFGAYTNNSPLQHMTGGNNMRGMFLIGADTAIPFSTKTITNGGLGLRAPLPNKSTVNNIAAYIPIVNGFIS